MENNAKDVASKKSLLNELLEGRDFSKQLYSILLKESSSSSSPNLIVARKTLEKIEKSLSILGYDPMVQHKDMGTADSPSSFNGSPKSPDSDGDFKDPKHIKDDPRKRKVIIPRCTLKVQGCCKIGLEGPVEDGYSWRKYGQKDILGAKYPRAYYRCTHRVQGCLATKQVQRSEEDPTYFEVTYRGKHNCYQGSSSSSIPNPPPKPEPSATPFFPQQAKQSQEIIWSFDTEIKDIKPITNANNDHITSPNFYVPSSSNNLAVSQETPIMVNNNYNLVDYHPNFPSCTSTYQPSQEQTMNNFVDRNQAINPQCLSTSAANSQDIMSELSFDQGELDPDFIFDNLNPFQ